MDDQNKKHNVGWVYVLWAYLDLTQEQAQKIANFDKQQRPFSLSNGFSAWERWDCEFYVFCDILDPKQLTRYVDKRDQEIKEHEQSLIEDDNSAGTLKEIERALEKINYLETDFLPAVSKKFHAYLYIKDPLHTKYNFLKAEYNNYLDKKHREIVADHFRHSRGFQPNTLKAKLLRHKIEAMYPEFSTFEKKMDDITKTVVEFLKCPPGFFDLNKKEMSSIFDSLNTFMQKAWDDYIKSGIHFYSISNSEDKRSEEEKDNDLYFSLLLIDGDYYGYK